MLPGPKGYANTVDEDDGDDYNDYDDDESTRWKL